MRCSFVFMAGALVLAGCADEAAELGSPVPTKFVTLHREVVAPPGPYSNALSARWLRQQAGTIAEGDMQAVHAEIVAARPGDVEALRSALIGAGIDPARITASRRVSKARRAPVIIFTRTVAAIADCSASIEFTFPDDPVPPESPRRVCQARTPPAR